MSVEDGNVLITKDTLFKLADNDKKVNLSQQQETESFFLLITSQTNALLRREKTANNQRYQIILSFDRTVIIQELVQLSSRHQWDFAVTKYLQTEFTAKLTHNHDNSAEFIVKLVNLLVNGVESSENPYNLSPTPPMDKLLHYQVEQERIFEQIKLQISQNFNLAEIIQIAIADSCQFLELDRLLIYQLNVALESNLANSEPVELVDTVTYEAKNNDNLASTLYFREEICWRNFTQCKNKYDQGFSLVIDDVGEMVSNLHPCLRSLMNRFEVKAKVVIPIKVKGKLWGLVIAHQCVEPRQWQRQDLQFLRQISEYLAIAIHHDQSYQQLQQQKFLLEKQVQTQAQQIKDALIAAEAASKSKHEFLGSMSHELRTPLTCVIGLSSTLLQWSSTKDKITLSPEKQQEYLYLIQQSGKHLLGLINNILEFSEVESGKHLLNIKKLSLIDVAKQSVQMLREVARAKQIVISSEIKLTPEQDYFFADEARLKEILFNLLSNGIKFTPEQGQVMLRIWREKRQVVLQVEDTGIGIAAAEMPLLFEKFKQLENFRHRTHGGAGLGLALTKKLVELHGGTIDVDSESGKGSVFTIYLPEKTTFRPSFNDRSSNSHQLSVASKTIMLITEDEESATFLCQLMNTIKCQVVWLMDAAMASNQVELLQPEIIIIDQDCSETGIKNLVATLGQKSFVENPELVLLGDRFENEQRQKFSAYGIKDCLLKSMNPNQIIDQINALIRIKADKKQG